MATLLPATPRRGGLSKSSTPRRGSNSSTSPMPTFTNGDRMAPSNSSSSIHTGRQLVERRCVLWVHDDSFSKDEVILNLKLFNRDNIKPGELMAIVALKTDSGVRDFQERSPGAKKGTDTLSASVFLDANLPDVALSKDGMGKETLHDANDDKRYLFAVKDMSSDLRQKQPRLEISISKHIADAFGFKNRSNVILTNIDIASTTASHVELSFKDEYLARSDMWRLTVMELSNKTVYKNQKITFLDTIKATITAVYIAGKKVQSAFFSSNTKPIFRSESARFVLFIQMSREMWDFDSEGTGEIMFTKVVNGFLPALFRRWMKLKARHLVSIVLFTRVEYDTGLTSELDANAITSNFYTGIQMDGNRKPYKDFYRVVVSEMASGEWTVILNQLKREFRFFRHDISMARLNSVKPKAGEPQPEYKGMGTIPGTIIEAEPSLAIHGNILEAINLASTQFSQDHIDRDLVRTGISIVVISAGTGIFEVDYENLRTTTETLVATGIGIDLVCLPKIPLHSVPLFRYRNPQYSQYQDALRTKAISDIGSTPRQQGTVFGSYSSFQESISPSKASGTTERMPRSSFASQRAPDEWNFAIPHWLDVSFWTGASQDKSSRPGVKLTKSQKSRTTVLPFQPFAIRCKMYELEMAGEISGTVEVSIAPIGQEVQLQSFLPNDNRIRIEGYEFIESKRKHTNFIDAHSHSKSVLRNNTSNSKDLFVRLDDYDKEKAFQSTGSPWRSKPDLRKQVRIAGEKTVKKALAEDPEVFGTSFNESKQAQDGLSLVGSAMSVRKKELGADSIVKSRKESFSSTKSAATSASTNASIFAKPPKLSRQISLGFRGFGIAAPKAAVAELQIENANAATVSTTSNDGKVTSSSVMASHLLATKATDKSSERPASSQGSQGSLRSLQSPAMKPVDSPSSKDGERARPITIKPATSDSTATGTVRSKLGSVYERTETTAEPDDLPTLEKLKSSDTLRASKAKLFSTANTDLPSTLSPTTALSPWLNVLNPSNPKSDFENTAGQYKRWQHIFPKPNKIKAMKWKSLCSPASVPLTTEYFPTKLQLDKEYERSNYSNSQEYDDDLSENPKTNEEFMRELIGLRLSQGFQIVVGPAVAEAFGQKSMKIANAFDKENIAEEGSSVFMSLGNIIHQLSCVNGANIEVDVFSRKVGTHDIPREATYKPGIMTTLAKEYEPRQIVLHKQQLETNWNSIDSYVSGNEEFLEQLPYWRARFVLIPVEQQKIGPRKKGEDTEEEVRLEGIKVLTQMWQRHRYNSEAPLQFKNLANRRIKHPNPLDIVYRTQDPSVVVNAELETLPLEDGGEMYVRRGKLLSDFEPFRKAKLDIAALAEAIQAPVEKGGVRMQNRRWHFRLHYNCFIGSDMTSWFLENFDDIETREEAVDFGNRLMVKEEQRPKAGDGTEEKSRDIGLFVHVEKRHPFRDGQYFYQVAGEHAKPRPETRGGWGFTTRRKDPSIPSTPMSETPNRESPKPLRISSSSGADERSSDSGSAATPVVANMPTGRRPKFYLSKVMKYNVDPKGASYRPERINLHYDRLHNPDNCYHIRIDWMNVTAKLIEDQIQSWAKTAERYKLRLIEVPIAEACTITENHPFRSPYILKLALQPPATQPPTFYDATSLGPQASTTRHFYQKAILRKFNFVLDTEAASYFPSNVDVAYSWGKPDYKYTQYIHRSGIGLAQITDDGDLILLANKLYNNRANASREAERFVKNDHHDLSGSIRIGNMAASPAASPIIRASQMMSPVVRATGASIPATGDVLLPGNRIVYDGVAPEGIKKELEDFCLDADRLEAFYKETLERASNPPSATPHQKTSVSSDSSMLDVNIPSFGLGPSLLSRESREASPSPMRLGTLPLPLPQRRQSTHPSDAGSGSVTDSPRGFFMQDDKS